MIFIGSRDYEIGDGLAHADPIQWLMPPTNSKDQDSALPQQRTLDYAIRDLAGSAMEHANYSAERSRIYDKVPAGYNWRYLRDHFGDQFLREVMGGAYQADGGRVGFWRRLPWERPSPTLPTSPVQKSTGLCHPDETRPLSVAEYARIQQFPDDFTFVGSTSAKYRQIGNAVPVGLAQAVGDCVMRSITQTPTDYALGRPTQRRLLESAAAK